MAPNTTFRITLSPTAHDRLVRAAKPVNCTPESLFLLFGLMGLKDCESGVRNLKYYRMLINKLMNDSKEFE